MSRPPLPNPRALGTAIAVYFAVLAPPMVLFAWALKMPPPHRSGLTMAILISLETVSMLVALVVYHRAAKRTAFLGRETRCGRCGQTLKALAEPRCPACGERL